MTTWTWRIVRPDSSPGTSVTCARSARQIRASSRPASSPPRDLIPQSTNRPPPSTGCAAILRSSACARIISTIQVVRRFRDIAIIPIDFARETTGSIGWARCGQTVILRRCSNRTGPRPGVPARPGGRAWGRRPADADPSHPKPDAPGQKRWLGSSRLLPAKPPGELTPEADTKVHPSPFATNSILPRFGDRR